MIRPEGRRKQVADPHLQVSKRASNVDFPAGFAIFRIKVRFRSMCRRNWQGVERIEQP
jgi:hypothetical protein